ncbi:Ig-like domain-containing protein [Pseudomonas frederiksbergensis]|uniref:Ig-like domain-containing protein n=1 Tax=Pseudomonas frederiksbergensis TaxID=104087 RepID=UPI003D1E127A
MDGQSNSPDDSNVFVLYPVMIPGWVTPVQPAGIADGGIPKRIYDVAPEGLECRIDPWTEFRTRGLEPPALNDRVDLYIDSLPTAVAGKTIQPVDVGQRIMLHVPKNHLVEGVNEIYYKVTRLSGNPQESLRLKVLYHAVVARVDPPQLPASINREMAEKGVEVIFNYYNRRPYDSIRLKIGNAVFNRSVGLDESNPIKTTLYTPTFEAAGDNPKTEVVSGVFDQLGNYSGDSDITETDVQVQPQPLFLGDDYSLLVTNCFYALSRLPRIVPQEATYTQAATGGAGGYVYESLNPETATVDSAGKVSALKNGKAVIRVRDSAGNTDSYVITVSGIQMVVAGPNVSWPGAPNAVEGQQWRETGLTVAQIQRFWDIYAPENPNVLDHLGWRVESLYWSTDNDPEGGISFACNLNGPVRPIGVRTTNSYRPYVQKVP